MSHLLRRFLIGVGCVSVFVLGMIAHAVISQSSKFSVEHIRKAEELFGLTFTPAQRDSMLQDMDEQLGQYQEMRTFPLTNDIAPAMSFSVGRLGQHISTLTDKDNSLDGIIPEYKILPKNDTDIAFLSVADLAHCIKTKQITSERLTQIYLARLKQYSSTLECTVTITEDLALAQARQADQEIAKGEYRGMLHGIPFGLKDLFAVVSTKTTWGSAPYKDQSFSYNATVYERLRQAGAVLVAKLTLGELAMGDVWFGGMTRNPWNLKQGSSGSSAGSASATSAGLVAFAIGTETLGSIVSPATRCGVSGLRPTYGRVSRHGAMALSWSMDKIGPICRTMQDCALVFHAIHGADSLDETTHNAPFQFVAQRPSQRKFRVGYLKKEFTMASPSKANDSLFLNRLQELASSGKIELVPVELPSFPRSAVWLTISAESSAAFDDLIRSGKDSTMVRQSKDAWPVMMRSARLIPAVEYIQANRHRRIVTHAMETMMRSLDVLVAPSFAGNTLTLTNFTGHPSTVFPHGFRNGSPTSISMIGRHYGEDRLLEFSAWMQVNDPEKVYARRPPLQ